MSTATTTSSPVDSAECIRAATLSTLAATCHIEAAPLADEQEPQGTVVMAVISLVGDVEWTVYMSLAADTASALASRFAGFPIAADSADLVDAIGELANILAGEMKGWLDRQGVRVNLSLPSVLKGEHVAVLIMRDAPMARLGFQTTDGVVSTGIVVGRKLAPAS